MDVPAQLTTFNLSYDEIPWDSLIGTFRQLRNECSLGVSHQNRFIPEIPVCVELLMTLLSGQLEDGRGEAVTALTTGAQFLANMSVGNTGVQQILWRHRQTLLRLFSLNHKPLSNTVCMLFNNILLSCDVRQVLLEESVLPCLLDQAVEGEVEFAQFAMETVLKSSSLDAFYDRLKPTHKVYVLDLLLESDREMDESTVRFLCGRFKFLSDGILQSSAEVEQVCPEEVERLVSVIGRLSGKQETSSLLLGDTSLLINTCCLLVALHHASKVPPTRTTCRPLGSVLGLKAGLVRVIGNLVYDRPSNQDLVRDLKCLPIIIDCCKIDTDNPFIMEWAIVAIRNLTRNNPQNQAFIASLQPTPNLP